MGKTRFTDSGGVKIAYQVHGSGPITSCWFRGWPRTWTCTGASLTTHGSCDASPDTVG